MQTFTSLIIAYKNREEIGDLLSDLSQHAPTSPVVVIDNASQDGSAELVASQFPAVYLVQNPSNIGFARAVNQGVAMCKTSFILLLNPDIRIEEKAVLSEMLAYLEDHPKVAAAAPLQYKQGSQRNRLNFTWSYLSRQAFTLYLEDLFQRQSTWTAPLIVPFLNMGCLMLRREAFERAGRLNEDYFLYGEEPDLFLKFKRYGYEACLLPQVSVLHFRDRSLAKVKLHHQLTFRMMGFRNILHALIVGYGKLGYDALVRKLIPDLSRDPSGRN